MKVYVEQLGNQLRGGLAPSYVISGDEPLQRMEAADSIRQAGKSAGYLHREIFDGHTGFDWGQFREACAAYSLFGEPRILDLRLTGKPDKAGAEALIRYAEQPAEDAILLVSAPKLTGADQKARWFQALDRLGVVIQVWPLEDEKLLRWLDRRLNDRGLLADRSGLLLLAARIEGNLLAGAQEIEKLHILYGTGQLIDEQILKSVADSARYDVFDLAEQVLRGHLPKAARVLAGLRGEGIAAPVVLWALTRELRLLNTLRTAIDGGLSAECAFNQQKLWDSRKATLGRALQRLNLSAIRRAFQLSAQADRVMKGQLPGNEWDALLRLCEHLTSPEHTPNHVFPSHSTH